MAKTRIRILLLLALCAGAGAQATDNATIWREFMAWAKAQPASASLQGYRDDLVKHGMTEAQASERAALIPKLINENPGYRQEISTLSFNRLYQQAADQDRFTLEPNDFLAAAVKDQKPGKALDVAMGQGRNAVFLAAKGWDVTGFDLAEEGLKASQANAEKAGVRIRTVKAAFEDFDYGKEQWDLIYFVYTDAPTAHAGFVARIYAALKPGGLLLLDRPYRSLTNPEPGWPETEEDKVNAHVKAWGAAGMQIVHYEDKTGIGEWRQTNAPRLEQKLRIIRILARKI
jgi:2-polyprenyl-3-methyl-5-hydroxy-6-metoxy-1,4-benzoquinol methylase